MHRPRFHSLATEIKQACPPFGPHVMSVLQMASGSPHQSMQCNVQKLRTASNRMIHRTRTRTLHPRTKPQNPSGAKPPHSKDTQTKNPEPRPQQRVGPSRKHLPDDRHGQRQWPGRQGGQDSQPKPSKKPKGGTPRGPAKEEESRGRRSLAHKPSHHSPQHSWPKDSL